jgi:hypothetical protein
VLYEYQPAPPEHLAASSHYQDAWPVRFEPADFGRFDSESESALLYGLLAAASRSRVGVERVDLWEGQVGDVPEYRLWAVSERGYQVDLRVYFGRANPTDSMLAEADAMLAGLEFPDWGLWELA